MKKTNVVLALVLALSVIAVAAAAAIPVLAAGKNGASLAGYKTIDICSVNDTTWRYSGVISVWNEGAIDTQGLSITDFIEYKTGSGPEWVKAFDVPVAYSGEIPGDTTQETALTFPYSVEGTPILDGAIRNNASITILNHSGHLDMPFGPNPKATYDGTMPPPSCGPLGCTYTQGYWGNKPDVVWPDSYSRDATFFLSGQTWQQVMDTPVNVSQGYYQLAHQYIAAVLNEAHGASVPSGVQDTLNSAYAWLELNGPSACTANGSCSTQKDWAATLDLYNNGLYPGGPEHCGDE